MAGGCVPSPSLSACQRPYPFKPKFSLCSPSCRIFWHDGPELHIETKCLVREFLRLERPRQFAHLHGIVNLNKGIATGFRGSLAARCGREWAVETKRESRL